MMTGLQPLQQDPDINIPTLKLRLLNALGIDTAGLLLTQDEKLQRMAEQSAQGAVVNGAAAAGQSVGSAAGQVVGEDVAQA
ncbi:head to tail connector protein [Cronobacter phage vB_CtuP_B1]|nr:head to tail connector protein [Cronobacter phage vB_CtuP_B1]